MTAQATAQMKLQTLSADFERGRRSAGLSQSALAVAAGVSRTTYERLLRGETVSARTVEKIRATLERARKGKAPTPSADDRLRRVIDSQIGYCARFYGLSLEETLAALQGEEKTGSARWRAAAHARQAGLYLCVTLLRVSQADVARLTGLTPAAVSLALGSVEDRRDEPDLDAHLRAAEACLEGSAV